jgi:membrane fusion protein (multidrug efflux system)
MKSFQSSGRIGQYYIISSGIARGERIVYEGIQNLREGMKVLPRQLPEDSLAAIGGK